MEISFSPQRQFLEKKEHAKAWANITASQTFVEAANHAMMMVVNQSSAKNSEEAICRQFEIQGARKLLFCLLALPVLPQPVKRPDPDNLRHDIKP